MKFAIVAFPSLHDDDRARIEAIRAQHDPQARLIAAHFTFVFPVELNEPSGLVAHVRHQLGSRRHVRFILDRATVVTEDGAAYCFLEPDRGASIMSELYDRFHRGPLAGLRRDEQPFKPHITVARHENSAVCQRLCDEINRAGLGIAGRIDSLDLVQINSDRVSLVERYTLYWQ